MFGSRRHRPPNPPLTAATANPNAATAAAAVFKRHESNSSLSAAAAAAALRARPMTPTRVAEVQTKRTIRRSASVASTGTASELQGRPGLQRRGSSGSMTERSFRTPSPHRPSSSGSSHHQTQSLGHDAPPVPALPKDVDTGTESPQARAQAPQHRRANCSGMSATPLRLASQKLGTEDAPAWFSAAKLGDPSNVRKTDPAMASPPSSPFEVSVHGEEPADGARPSSQASSINFSYPARTRVNSLPSIPTSEVFVPSQTPTRVNQPQSSVEDGQTAPIPRIKQQTRGQPSSPPSVTRSASKSSDALVYDPNSRRMVRQAELLPIQRMVLDASQRPTKKKRAPQRAGSHLAAGTMSRTKSDASRVPGEGRTRPVSAHAQTQPPAPVGTAPAREVPAIEEPAVKAIIHSPRIEAKRLEQQRAQEAVELAQISAQTALGTTTDATRYAVRRQPSVVKEEPEPEDPEPEKKVQRVISDALDAVPARQRMYPEPDTESSPRTQPSLKAGVPVSPPHSLTDQMPKQLPGLLQPVEISRDEESKHDAVRRAQISRTHSNSPARQAHFGPVQNNLTVRHSPPPRSVSPRKSALKHTSPPRAASPSGDTSETSGSVNQEPLARKKSVRVSFDDGNTAVAGDSTSQNRGDSALLASPMHANRHRWLSNLGNAKKDLASLEDDEVMRPRPALPSFGSVRDRKPRDTCPDQDERPLVRPRGEIKYTSPLLPSPPLGPSNDHAIGTALAKEHEDGSKHAANTSRLREPLPPVVTSVEGTGYESDSSSTSSLISSVFEPSEAPIPPAAAPLPVEVAESQTPRPEAAANGAAANCTATNADTERLSRVIKEDGVLPPQISSTPVSQHPPAVMENKSLRQYLVEIPGGFPEDESDQSAASAAKKLTPVAMVVPPTVDIAKTGQSTSAAAQVSHGPAAESTSDAESSIYSDAYEDLSDVEGGGFQSLDAVVESPMRSSPRAVAVPRQVSEPSIPQLRERPPHLQTDISSATTAVEVPSSEIPLDEWERAKAYWRSLTAEKRAQLEKEAREDAGIEADLEEVKTEAKPKKKKSVERRNSERKALTVHMAQQMMAQQEKASNPERNYMIKPGARWNEDDLVIPPMRKTMREVQHQASVPAPAVNGARLRKSMRASGSSADGSESQRPMSSPPATAAPSKGGHRRSATGQVELVRQGSTGSESSFKRSRPGSKLEGSGFRQSLRPTSPNVSQAPSKRFSLRALSPTGSSKRDAGATAATTPATQMRRTLRDSPTEKTRSTGIRLPSFGLPYGGKKSSGSGTKARSSAGSRFSSRFADSSDEEGGGIASSGFRSRFEDSSDDDAPVLPMPMSAPLPKLFSTGHSLRKQTSLASTALPEEMEESEETNPDPKPATANTTTAQPQAQPQPTPAMDTNANTTSNIRRSRSGHSGRGQLLPASRTAPALGTAAMSSASGPGSFPSLVTAHDNPKSRHSRRNSLMSVLRRRTSKSDGGGGGKIGRGEVSESAARRDTRLERSVGELKGIRRVGANAEGEREGDTEAEGESLSSPVPRSPKLQKRASVSGPSRTTPDANPAESVGRYDDAERRDDGFAVGNGGGGGKLKRSAGSGSLGTRTLSGGNGLPLQQQESALSMGASNVEGASVAGGSSMRRKRFGALRRMFRLDE
ncbi:hypothetical protein MFIFM68171_02028 [Madurella fahalii]|uniref:Uncharacterized protein n=1 Tax=Madurella fahalii TaxID=1157608 RepID=A0ABQ0G232_9PEZI